MIRKHQRCRVAVFATMVSVLWTGVGCSSDESGGDDGETITIGASASLSGKYASSGTSVANGYQLAVDTINADGGINGRKLELKVEDDKSDPTTVTRIYTTHLTDENVSVTLGPYGSALAGAAMQLAERYKKPLVHSLTSYAPAFLDAEYSVMAGMIPSERLFADLPKLVKQAGYTDIGLVAGDVDALKGICSGIPEGAKKAGLKIVVEESYAATTSDFSSIALKVKDAAPQVVVACSLIQDSIGLTRALDQQGFRPKMLAVAAAEDLHFESSLGELANHVIGYSTWVPALKIDQSEKFAKDYEKVYGAKPSSHAASAFATVQALAGAIKAADGTDPEGLNKMLHTGSFDTILGTYKVDEKGVQTGYTPVLTQFQEGSPVVVYPKSDVSRDVEATY